VEVEPKLLELLHEAVPSAAIMALLVNPTNPNAATQSRPVQEAAQRLGVQVHVLNASTPADFDPLFAKLQDLQVAALVISQDVLFGAAAEQLGKLAVHYKIPGIYLQREFAAAGGLMSYGTDARDAYRQAGIYAGRILKGERPSDLPVMQAAKFDLVINLKTAKAFGLNLPLPLLGRADEVIDRQLLCCDCSRPLMAHSAHPDALNQCLLGVERTSAAHREMSANDPKRTSADIR
jgi:putative ABC transport system substrate-binding protein